MKNLRFAGKIFREPTGCECAPVVQYQSESNNNTNQSNTNNHTSQSDSNFTNQSSNRIMGGFEVLPNKLPYQVLIKVILLYNVVSLFVCKVGFHYH